MSQHPLCFVLMPFGRKPDATGRVLDFDAVYQDLIRPAIDEAGLEAIRADEEMVSAASSTSRCTSGCCCASSHAPEPGVMDLGGPTNLVIFRGVVFDGVDFRSWIRPEWFVDCWIRRSVLPAHQTRELLERGGNQVEDVAWLDQEVAH